MRLARAVACAILGHRSNIADRKTFVTIAFTHDGPVCVDRGRWIYEPCSRCGALFCLEFGTPEAVQLPSPDLRVAGLIRQPERRS